VIFLLGFNLCKEGDEMKGFQFHTKFKLLHRKDKFSYQQHIKRHQIIMNVLIHASKEIKLHQERTVLNLIYLGFKLSLKVNQKPSSRKHKKPPPVS